MEKRIESIKSHVEIAEELLKIKLETTSVRLPGDWCNNAVSAIKEWLDNPTRENRIKLKFTAGDVVNLTSDLICKQALLDHSEPNMNVVIAITEFISTLAYDAAFIECENPGHVEALHNVFKEQTTRMTDDVQ